MWIMCKHGFFSAVQHAAQPDTLIVRARNRDDLVALIKNAELPANTPVEHTPFADYPYRAHISKRAFADYVCSQAKQINYPNFKNAIALISRAHARTYAQVWAVLHALEDRLARTPRYGARTIKRGA